MMTPRSMLADELPYLHVAERGLLRALDIGWSVTRGAVWLATVPWSMLLIGVKGPGAFRRGHRGPIRRALSRVFGRNDFGDGARDRDSLDAAADGALASLEGTVRALDHDGLVWTRIDATVETVWAFTERWRLVHEDGRDFELVLDDGTIVRVITADAYLVAKPGDEREPDQSWLAKAPLPARMPDAYKRVVESFRRELRDGERVRIVGTKARSSMRTSRIGWSATRRSGSPSLPGGNGRC